MDGTMIWSSSNMYFRFHYRAVPLLLPSSSVLGRVAVHIFQLTFNRSTNTERLHHTHTFLKQINRISAPVSFLYFAPTTPSKTYPAVSYVFFYGAGTSCWQNCRLLSSLSVPLPHNWPKGQKWGPGKISQQWHNKLANTDTPTPDTSHAEWGSQTLK